MIWRDDRRFHWSFLNFSGNCIDNNRQLLRTLSLLSCFWSEELFPNRESSSVGSPLEEEERPEGQPAVSEEERRVRRLSEGER